jgi:hypothetical protein
MERASFPPSQRDSAELAKVPRGEESAAGWTCADVWCGEPGRLRARPRCLSDLSRRDRTIVARQFIAWTMYKGRRVPEGRMMRGEREIALTTPVSLTAFQPSTLSGTDHLSYGSRHFMPGYDHRSLRDKIRRAPRALARL